MDHEPFAPNTPTPPPETVTVPQIPETKLPEKALRESLTTFFDNAFTSATRIDESMNELDDAGAPLHYAYESAHEAKSAAQRVTAPQSQELFAAEISRLSHDIDEQWDNYRGQIKNSGMEHTDAFLRDFAKRKREWIDGPSSEEFFHLLEEAVKIEDAEAKNAQLDKIRNALFKHIVEPIKSSSDELSLEFAQIKDVTEQKKVPILGRIQSSNLEIAMTQIHRSQPDLWYRLQDTIGEIGKGAGSFYNKIYEPLDSIPGQFRLIATLSQQFGVEVSQIMETMKKIETEE